MNVFLHVAPSPWSSKNLEESLTDLSNRISSSISCQDKNNPDKSVLPTSLHVFYSVVKKYRSSTLTHSVVLLWCKKGSYLAEGKAIMALLWIMRQLFDPYLKVSVSSCPCRSPSLHYSLLHYRWWPWQHLIANNIHLNKPFHEVKILTNCISFEKRCKWRGDFIFYPSKN